MNLDKIELHDAQLKSMHVDYVAKSVTVNLEYYKSEEDSKRKAAAVVFEKVETVSQIGDLEKLQDNARAGNVVFWHPANGSGTTEIYLTGGILAITAKKVRFKELK